MVAGRPREYDRDEIQQIMMTWADSPDATSILRFLADHDLDYDTVYAWVASDAKFSNAYNKMKLKIGANREKKAECGELYFGVYSMHQRNYDPTIELNMRADKELDAKLRKEAPEGEVHIHLPSGNIKKARSIKK